MVGNLKGSFGYHVCPLLYGQSPDLLVYQGIKEFPSDYLCCVASQIKVFLDKGRALWGMRFNFLLF